MRNGGVYSDYQYVMRLVRIVFIDVEGFGHLEGVGEREILQL